MADIVIFIAEAIVVDAIAQGRNQRKKRLENSAMHDDKVLLQRRN